ncbi:hypothetical protein AB0F91_34655 [Amycolatopsis sp. NPDC023774]|uniref:hypothetical protein n=1 Tax=Amycolatopsis sp. NPDC023774 TaxID=3155015 RepID=UPI0033EDE228
MGSANQGYRMLGGTTEGPIHLGAIAAAVIRLAYNTPRTEYTVRFTTEPMNRLPPWKVDRVLPAVRSGSRVSDRSEIVAFTITEEKDADAWR